MESLSNLRQQFKEHQLAEGVAYSEPLKQFDVWFTEAMNCGVSGLNIFILATVSENGTPEARVMLLKGVDNGGYVFYTNYESDKAKAVSYTHLEKLKSDMTQMFKNGFAEKLDIDKLTVTLNNTKAAQNQANNGINISLAVLKSTLGISQSDSIVLTDQLDIKMCIRDSNNGDKY